METSYGTVRAASRAVVDDAPAESSDVATSRNRFQLQAVLGKGAYGTVYRALDRVTGEVVAVKAIPVTDQDREEFRAIQREISFLADCNHPNVVRYLGSYRTPNELWIVMEYCGGGSVSDLIAASGEPLPEELIAHICGEALKGLAYLHSLGKVHRDIKCGNILLTATGEVKIADFGVSAQLTNTMSKRQTFIGTPHWMAPEVIQESRYDGKVDVWALGVCAIEMAETVPPRWAVHPVRVIFMISRDPPPRLTRQPERWSPLLHDFVSQALIKDPKQRPTARYLLLHRFVVMVAQRPPGLPPPPGLLPLIDRAQQYLQNSAALTGSQPPGAAPELRDLAGLATGRFSWRDRGTAKAGVAGAGHGGGGGAAAMQLAGAAEGPTAAAAALAAAQTVRAGGGRVFTPPQQPASPSPSTGYDSTVVFKEDYGNTVVVHDDPYEYGSTVVVRQPEGSGPGTPPPAAAEGSASTVVDYGSTMVVASDTVVPYGRGAVGAREGPASTVRRHGRTAVGGGGDGGADEGGGYMAAVRAAAAEAQQRDRGVRSSESPAQGAPTAAPTTSELDRVRDRLHAICDGGLVLPLPFLRAAEAQPLALLGGWGAAAGAGGPQQQTSVWGTAAGAGAEDGAGGGCQLRQPPVPADTCGVDPEAYGVVLELAQQSAAMAVGQQQHAYPAGASGGGVAQGQGQQHAVDMLPPTVVTQLLFHPGLQNLARTLSYSRRCLALLPLDRGAREELQDGCDRMSAALQCILSL